MPARKATPVGTPRTQRLRKVQCPDCDYVAYISRWWMDTGLPGCPCGGRLIPDDPEDAARVLSPDELEAHPWHQLYRQALAGAEKAQTRCGQSLKFTARRTPEEIALAHVERARREAGRAARLAAIAPVPATMPF